ncbi:MAG: TetR/AcrR family transcriptional regulator [Firmicutes bacterium]|nr:TetR/AcrR family transcriptional regulator [Bacillota bacterium]
MAEKKDLRIIKSKKAIKSAFLELLQERGYSGITVKDIADRAIINRKTFYTHYETKDDLYNEIMQEILDKFTANHFIESLHKTAGKQQNDIIMSLLDSIKSVRREFLILLNDDTNTAFRDSLKQRLQAALISKEDTLIRAQDDEDFFRLILDVYFNVFMRVLCWWLEGERDDPHSFIETVLMLFSSKPLEMLGLKEETLNEYGKI